MLGRVCLSTDAGVITFPITTLKDLQFVFRKHHPQFSLVQQIMTITYYFFPITFNRDVLTTKFILLNVCVGMSIEHKCSSSFLLLLLQKVFLSCCISIIRIILSRLSYVYYITLTNLFQDFRFQPVYFPCSDHPNRNNESQELYQQVV